MAGLDLRKTEKIHDPDLIFLERCLRALALICIIRMAICLSGPEVLYNSNGLIVDLIGVAAAVAFGMLGRFYIRIRREKTLGLLLFMPSFICMIYVSSIQAQYIIFYLGRHNGFVDRDLASIDQILKFDWVAYFEFILSCPTLHQVMKYAYDSIWVQPLILSMIFAVRKSIFDFCRINLALSTAFILVCGLALFMPALGAYQFHHMTPDRHLGIVLTFTDGMTAPMLWLRQGTFTSAMPDFGDIRLITFPSFHASTAIVFILVAWPLRGYRWVFLIINTLMLMITPVQGSHYLTDIIVGSGIGGVSYILSTMVLRLGLGSRDRSASLDNPSDAPPHGRAQDATFVTSQN